MEVNRDTRVGRMLDALLRSPPGDGRIDLTIAVEGRRKLHESFRLRTWNGGDRFGRGYLFVSIPSSADWDARPRVKPITPVSVNLDTGELREDLKDERVTPLLLWMARAVLRYAQTGEVPKPMNGTVSIVEASVCGACGRPLTDDTSIALGIGPDCEKQLYGKTTPRSRPARSA
jgi:Family of unknown function (DUF6011)